MKGKNCRRLVGDVVLWRWLPLESAFHQQLHEGRIARQPGGGYGYFHRRCAECLRSFSARFEVNWILGGSLCLACAKRLSSRLDAVINQIEAEYRPNLS